MKAESFRYPNVLAAGKDVKSRFRMFMLRLCSFQVESTLTGIKSWMADRHGRILEVGCGDQPYRDLLPETCKYQGLEWSTGKDTFGFRTEDTAYYTGDTFPFADNCFDSVLHTGVLEHVYDYRKFMMECRRVLKPGGAILVNTPFAVRHHYIPYDYFRFTRAALEKLFADTGFEVYTIEPRGTDVTVAMYKNYNLIYRLLYGTAGQKLVGALLLPALPILLLIGHISMRFKIGSPDDCLGYIVKGIKKCEN